MIFIKQLIRKRKIILFLGFSILFICILIRLGYLCLISSKSITKKALNLWSRDIPIEGIRGSIYDRNGKLIVGSKLTPSIACIPKQVVDKEYASSTLSKILNVSKEDILYHLNKNVSIELIKPEGRKISTSQAQEILESNLEGIYIVGDTTRYYPYKETLAQVLGFTGIDNQGLSGIEAQYDSYLNGSEGSLSIYTDAKGNLLKDIYSFYMNGTKGFDLYLTIDLEIQLIIERVLREAEERYHPYSMWSLAMNPKTGEILAMTSYPSFNPEKYQEYSQEIYNRNLPIWACYEPGSVFKIVTYSAGLEENVFDLEDPFYCHGYSMISGVRIKDWKAGGHGSETFLQVIQNSCNPGFMEIGNRLGKERLFQYIRSFGFGSKTGIDMVGESTGIVFNIDQVGPLELATASFGQGNSVTAIQLVTAASAAVNGGYLMKPYILDKISLSEVDSVIYQGIPHIKNEVISRKTSSKVSFALENVVALGTGRSAYVNGYRVGGKTGTSQKAKDGVYLENNYIISFLGIAPMNNPEIAIYIALDNPKNTIQYGGVVAAPLIGEMLEEILPILKVKKDLENQISKENRWYIDTPYYKVENYIGKEKKSIKPSSYYKIQYSGSGNYVIAQFPFAGEEIKEGGSVLLFLSDSMI